MRRAKAMLVIVALLATPLALVARAMACESAACTMMCCLPHGFHPHAGQPMTCHCQTKSGKQLPDFGLIAPIAPTMTEQFVAVDAPDAFRRSMQISSQAPTQGFSIGPFNPPRS
ncbi:MAG TPA: hypothetical protein VEJ46_00450 [Candidatus Acidoferrum sp.]|nr:hypothetical protein [Candidatus Acidoferrum sp.]